MEVNEVIIREWLNLCRKQFTIADISFKVWGPKGGSNYSNVDIFAVDAKGKFFDYEVKWRSIYSLSATDREKPGNLVRQMTRKEWVEAIQKIIGTRRYEKVLITTRVFFGKSEEKNQKMAKYFAKKEIDLVFFEDVIKELVDHINIKGRYNSPVLQTIRILKMFSPFVAV